MIAVFAAVFDSYVFIHDQIAKGLRNRVGWQPFLVGYYQFKSYCSMWGRYAVEHLLRLCV